MRIQENHIKKELYRQNKTISKNLRFLRLLYEYNQQDLADVLHLSRSAYYSIESGTKTLDFESLSMLSDFYNIDIDYLVSFDISNQLLNLIRVDRKSINATAFLEKYFSLSRSGKEQIKSYIDTIAAHEKDFRKFPWEYEGLEDMLEREENHVCNIENIK